MVVITVGVRCIVYGDGCVLVSPAVDSDGSGRSMLVDVGVMVDGKTGGVCLFLCF